MTPDICSFAERVLLACAAEREPTHHDQPVAVTAATGQVLSQQRITVHDPLGMQQEDQDGMVEDASPVTSADIGPGLPSLDQDTTPAVPLSDLDTGVAIPVSSAEDGGKGFALSWSFADAVFPTVVQHVHV